jgi:drug/metabolite transporter (DMT)-like permease
LIWVVILSRVKLSFALPMMSTTYIFVVFLSWLVLKEEVPLIRLIGVFVICAGVFLVSRGR